jgi:hypothetical protein
MAPIHGKRVAVGAALLKLAAIPEGVEGHTHGEEGGDDPEVGEDDDDEYDFGGEGDVRVAQGAEVKAEDGYFDGGEGDGVEDVERPC